MAKNEDEEPEQIVDPPLFLSAERDVVSQLVHQKGIDPTTAIEVVAEATRRRTST